MNTGRLKVFASLTKYLEERRLYQCDERGQIIAQGDNLQDALRCLANEVCRMRTKPKPHIIPTHVYAGGDQGWMV